MENKDFKWYMIRVVHGKEKKAIENIKTEIRLNSLEEYVEDYLAPTEKRIILSKGKKIQRETMVFSGYIMMKISMNGEIQRVVRRTNLITGFAGDTNNNPIPLRQSEVDKIIGDIETSHSPDTHFIGDMVKVIDGAFSGFNGEITKIDTDKRKFEINVKIFGRETPMELKFEQCEKIKN